MKEGIHPDYREVVFQDVSAGFSFLTRSTIRTKDTIVFEGNTYPLVKLDISSASHPFFTGKMKYVDSTGQIERFKKKFGGNYGQKKPAADKAAAEKSAEGEAK